MHSAIWTGAEMIIWGGGYIGYFDIGGRYNPIANSWTATSDLNAPFPWVGQTAIWTGTEMIVWGGSDNDGISPVFFNGGGKYNPLTNSWAPTSINNAPSGRVGQSAVWTGTEMIIWGGGDGSSNLDTGGRYWP
jgi:N-acetylneuraminic acid mutarotase